MKPLDINSILKKFPEGVRTSSKPLGIWGSLFGIFCIGMLDYLTGSELSFSIFYLIPISIATLSAGPRWGMAISVLSAGVWYLADQSAGIGYNNMFIPLWNTLMRFGYFSLHTALLTVLVTLLDQMRTMALTDSLTGAANWRNFEGFARRELQKSSRSGLPITVAYADLDNFKAINDHLGHDAGDLILRMTVQISQKNIRPGDMVARIGGDEFVFLFPETDFDGASHVLERIRTAFHEEMKQDDKQMTMSIGAYTYAAPPASVEDLLKRADNLMYTVKQGGKNGLRHEEETLLDE
jgi:diguanylate cyclase (GGDEF)-like protein